MLYTQQEKILLEMLRRPEKEWFYAPDFMQQGEYNVGYEASPRMTEVVKLLPEFVEAEKRGKYRYIRLNWPEIGRRVEQGGDLTKLGVDGKELAFRNWRFAPTARQ